MDRSLKERRLMYCCSITSVEKTMFLHFYGLSSLSRRSTSGDKRRLGPPFCVCCLYLFFTLIPFEICCLWLVDVDFCKIYIYLIILRS
ncbi:hypothetical protein BRADI_2g55573v3 [Brachypodium distachyon]|uniref:Uncharacterized protein n=1 Tax=Brachypodium distachyon TaxID=15368 RepID=A0A2K2DG16_BRADI|nr:hypothetical protein BRADI_2g55573v3 [Brachypodium distachyon]